MQARSRVGRTFCGLRGRFCACALPIPKEGPLGTISVRFNSSKCLVVTTSSIAGLQGNSIKYHTLDKDGTQKVLVGNGCFNLLHDAHHSWGFYGSRGNLRR